MRLSEEERRIIRATCREVFAAEASVRLFGSRVRDEARGGDIDLFIECDPELATLGNELRCEELLHDALGERRIDLVVHPRGRPLTPIAEVAIARGVDL